MNYRLGGRESSSGGAAEFFTNQHQAATIDQISSKQPISPEKSYNFKTPEKSSNKAGTQNFKKSYDSSKISDIQTFAYQAFELLFGDEF